MQKYFALVRKSAVFNLLLIDYMIYKAEQKTAI